MTNFDVFLKNTDVVLKLILTYSSKKNILTNFDVFFKNGLLFYILKEYRRGIKLNFDVFFKNTDLDCNGDGWLISKGEEGETTSVCK